MEFRENTAEYGHVYGRWQIAKDTWCITDHWNNFVYLLIGKERAMLIDTCSGEGNLREVVESITDKAVMVVNTHGHFDHTGGNSCWEEAWMTKEAAVHAKEPFDAEHEKWFRSKPYPDYKVNYLKDGDVIELGDWSVKVLAIPAHSEGSIALLDEKNRFLFCGDEIECGQVIWFVRNHAVPLKEMAAMHKKNMEKLKQYLTEYDLLWPAHNGAPLYPKPYLDDFIALDEAIIDGRHTVLSDTSGFNFLPDTQAKENLFSDYGKLYRSEKGLASIVYSESDMIYHNK